MNTGFQADKNMDTNKDGYFIRYAGSLWAGQCNTQNTIDEILALAEKYHYEPFTYLKQHGDKWYFMGNFRQLSNVFDVVIWDRNIANKCRMSLLRNSTRKC